MVFNEIDIVDLECMKKSVLSYKNQEISISVLVVLTMKIPYDICYIHFLKGTRQRCFNLRF